LFNNAFAGRGQVHRATTQDHHALVTIWPRSKGQDFLTGRLLGSNLPHAGFSGASRPNSTVCRLIDIGTLQRRGVCLAVIKAPNNAAMWIGPPRGIGDNNFVPIRDQRIGEHEFAAASFVNGDGGDIAIVTPGVYRMRVRNRIGLRRFPVSGFP
jgi:hypothetical protein